MSLVRLIAGRAVGGGGVLLVVAVATFGLLAAQPGTVADRYDDPRIPAATRAARRAQAGLDRPWPARLRHHLAAAARGDLGWSVARAQPVGEALRRAAGPSLLLGASGLLLGVLGGLLLGTWQGVAPGRPADRWTSRAATVVAATPDFWLAMLLLTVGAKWLRLFPAGGWPRDAALPTALHHLVLPVITLALLVAARVSRYHRPAVAGARAEGWARAARARGLTPSRIRWHHLARAAAAPTIALAGLLAPMVIAGAVFVEVVFAWPGIGRLLLVAVQARDVPLAIGATLATALAAVVGSVVADVAHGWLDPRTRDA
ncbi:MAG: ABC transporter permease [Gemmatimonadota bacterium]